MRSERPQRWEKLGLVYCASGESGWAQSHAFIPTTFMPDDETIRVYVAFLDSEKIGRIGYVDVAAADPRKVLGVSANPCLDVGATGCFDEHGVTPTDLLDAGGKLFLYYVGWQRQVSVRYTLFAGLAVSDDRGASFRRVSQTPILDRSDGELFTRTAAHVEREGDAFRMWYIGGDKWIEVDGKQVPSYSMRHLVSADGVNWGREGAVCMTPEGPDEYGFGRPFVVKDESGAYRMWYSVRTVSKGYRLGYAESADGLSWERMDDEAGIDVSAAGWDSEMVCFSCVQPTRHGTYMFYNGNGYGQTGFGVAVLRT